MELINCINCDTAISESAIFCHNCGERLKCKSCGDYLLKGGKFCNNCGVAVEVKQNTIGQQLPLNTIKYKKSNEEVSCEISFTDNIGKDGMNDLISAIVNNRIVQNSNADRALNETFEIQPKIENGLKIDQSGSDTAILTTGIPHINDIESRVNCSENVWIGIHAFYLSNYGGKNFNKDDVRDAYMDRRKTSARSKNFASEWKKAHHKYFKTINANELGFQFGVIEQLKNIILGGKSTVKKKAGISGGTKKTPAKSIAIEEFDLSRKENKLSLEDFFAQKKPGENTYDRILVIAYYITKINNAEIFTEGQIEYGYKALQLNDRPSHLRQTINNIKNAKVWFKDISKGQWALERIGEIYVDDKLPAIELLGVK